MSHKQPFPKYSLQIFQDVQNGLGIPPDVCASMVGDGLAEWIDVSTDMPVDMNHPRSLLRLTDIGMRCYAEASSFALHSCDKRSSS